MSAESPKVLEKAWFATTSSPWGISSESIDARPGAGVSIVEKESVKSNERFESARQKLTEFLGNQPFKKDGGQTGWTDAWDYENRLSCENSIRTLFPREINNNAGLVVRTLNTLERNGIHTRSELAERSIEEIEKFWYLGEKGMIIVGYLKEMLSATEEVK